jgi:NADPH:quinone reductase-like Zn-dependent oxidoreductase
MGSKAELLEAMKFVVQGKIRAVVDRVLPLSEARQAHELMENRGQFGKIILEPIARTSQAEGLAPAVR